jgi:hypothetical protein
MAAPVPQEGFQFLFVFNKVAETTQNFQYSRPSSSVSRPHRFDTHLTLWKHPEQAHCFEEGQRRVYQGPRCQLSIPGRREAESVDPIISIIVAYFPLLQSQNSTTSEMTIQRATTGSTPPSQTYSASSPSSTSLSARPETLQQPTAKSRP